MDEVTFVFAFSAPVLAVALFVFASVSDAYIEREVTSAVRDYNRVGLKAEVRESIGAVVFRVSKGALLISNCIATSFNVVLGLFGAIYFLPKNYFVILGATMLVALFMIGIIKTMVRYGVKDLYIQRVRRSRLTRSRHAAYGFTYGTLIDRGMIMLNMALMGVVLFVYRSIRSIFMISLVSYGPELGTGRGVRLYETEPKYAPERCTPEYAERLERLRRKSGVASYAEVVRDALKRHDQIEQVMSSGDKLVVEKADGTKILLML